MSDSLRLKGIAASMGVAIGSARVRGWGRRRLSFRRIDPGEAAKEVERFQRAVSESRAEIEAAREDLSEQYGMAYASILDVYLLMHGDALLIEAICDVVNEDHINAEWAVTRVAERLKAPLLRDSSSYFRERASDIDHVREHLLRHLCGEDRAEPAGEEPVVLITRDLTPADAVHLLAAPTVGLVTEAGARSSHTAILARTFGVPAVVGVGPLPLAIEEDQQVVVDGFTGDVIIGASPRERSHAEARRDRFLAFLEAEQATSAVTRDGTSIVVSANMELPGELGAAVESGAEGVGLYRTEFMCLDRAEPPSGEEQLEIYRAVASTMSPHMVVFRTFDWRGDKRPPVLDERDVEPLWLRTQIKAVLRASPHGSVALMFPMISTVRELANAKAIVDECRRDLDDEDIRCSTIPIGMMVEVPSAALLAERFAQHADFFAVGTNDLSRYTLAVDRNDGRDAFDPDPLDPAVLRLVDRTVRAARDARIPCSMCGDMAANPLALGLALGMGYRQVSVPVRMLPLARSVIRSVDLEIMSGVVRDALECESAKEVQTVVSERMGAGFYPWWTERAAV